VTELPPIVIDLSELPLCEFSWEFHEEVLQFLPADILTTNDYSALSDAVNSIDIILLNYEYLYPDDDREFTGNCKGYGRHTCITEVYNKWIDVLEEKMSQCAYLPGGNEPGEIRIIPPTHILPDTFLLPEPGGKASEQPPAQVEPEEQPVTQHSQLSPILIDFSANTYCLDEWEFHEWIITTFPEILTTRNSEVVERVQQAIIEETNRRAKEDFVCLCLFDIVNKWQSGLQLQSKIISLRMPERTKIQIVPPAQVLPGGCRWKHSALEEELDRPEAIQPEQPSSSDAQPADQFVPPHRHIPKPEKSVSEFLANIDDEE
jgi:hypothetical protein